VQKCDGSEPWSCAFPNTQVLGGSPGPLSLLPSLVSSAFSLRSAVPSLLSCPACCRGDLPAPALGCNRAKAGREGCWALHNSPAPLLLAYFFSIAGRSRNLRGLGPHLASGLLGRGVSPSSPGAEGRREVWGCELHPCLHSAVLHFPSPPVNSSEKSVVRLLLSPCFL